MLHNILIATDASAASDHVVDRIKDLRRVGSRQALLTHVLNIRNVGVAMGTSLAEWRETMTRLLSVRHEDELYQQLKQLALPRVEAQQRRLAEAGFETSIEIPTGPPAARINQLAGDRASSLIVIGSQGASLAGGMGLGSTAAAVLQSSRAPVLLVRIEPTEAAGGASGRAAGGDLFGRVLHPTDFSDTAERAFQYLAHIVSRTQCAATLLHVQDKAKIDPHLKDRLEEFNRIDQERLERRKEQLLKAGASFVDIQIPYGSPTAAILEEARRGHSSLILMGTQGRGFIQELFLGSVSHNVARHARLPVLFVPALR